MSKTIRIRTEPGSDEKYVKIKLEQDFDFLEILSLKIGQDEAYSNFCSNYGVVAGRVSVNGGFGLPNVKVSIFIPILVGDKDNDIISQIYPYESVVGLNSNGVRYNLLPNRKQHVDHTPVGTFPEKREVLDDETFIEVYEKYYKYTTKTNEAGDFMLFGVPIGEQQLFYDLDISDIGFLSARPYELIAAGTPKKAFEDKFTFRSSRVLTELTQLKSNLFSVEVKPFWCDSLNIGREIGITRQDIPITDFKINPTAIFMGSVISDNENDAVSRNCRPKKKLGDMNELITGSGTVEILRRTQRGDIEVYGELGEDLIDDNGAWSFQLPMNLRKVVTAEDGTLVPSSNGVDGIATETDVRFRITMAADGNDKKRRTRAKMLVPNMTGNYKFSAYSKESLRKAENSGDPIFEINDQTSLTPVSLEDDPANEYNYLKEFFTFRWKKVYTIRQYIARFQPAPKVTFIEGISEAVNDVVQLPPSDENRNFIGIKDITEGVGMNKVPFNRIDTNVNALYSLFCIILSLIGFIVAIINGILNIINSLITFVCQVKVSLPCFYAVSSSCQDNKPAAISQGGECKNLLNFALPCGIRLSGGSIKIAPPKLNLPKVVIKWIRLQIGYCTRKYCLFSDMCNSCSNDDDGPGAGASCERCCSGPVKLDCSQPVSCNCEDAVGLSGCCQRCCEKIPLIALKCPDGNIMGKPLVIPTPIEKEICNTGLINACLTCGGVDFTIIRDWVNCQLEGLAAKLGIIKFDFYNDWINGALYFPLIKRKYKVKKKKKKSGQIKKDKFCDFNCYDTLTNRYLLNPIPPTLIDGNNERKDDSIHGKPNYKKTIDPDLGLIIYLNESGHAHHQNKCISSYLIERKEFAKVGMDCIEGGPTLPPDDGSEPPGGGIDVGIDVSQSDTIDPDCSAGCNGGVKACSTFCLCLDTPLFYNYRYGVSWAETIIKHGIVKWEQGEIYYSAIIPENSSEHNINFIKGNLLYPTNITELGSSVFCDIDDQPFIIDKLEPTSYRISERPVKASGKEPKSTLNISTYADIGCTATKCISTKNSVMSSQLGVDILDVTDDGREITNPKRCGAFFDHDTELRSYFCRRFTPYVGVNLESHYNQPSTVNRENTYESYPEIEVIGLEDDDPFNPGDRCKIFSGANSVGTGNYFYGMVDTVTDLPKTPHTLSNTQGVNLLTTESPYFFYFGLHAGRTALHKTIGKFFADKINKETLERIDEGSIEGPKPTDGVPSANSIIATCLNKS